MTELAERHGAVNLGQGFPDFPSPDFVKRAAVVAVEQDINQYAPSAGRFSLRAAIARRLELDYGWVLDPAAQIVVTHGATEALFAAMLALVDPGDEVIVFEPAYDSYVPSIEMAGGVPRYYTLEPPAWAVDRTALEALFTPRTRLILLNTPHNPTGKVFAAAELETIAALCRERDVIAVTDEVYEHIVFDGARHRPLATLPGMEDRTITISSLGKTFSVTGWKVGWAAASPELAGAIVRAHQFITFCGAAPLQEAAARALAAPSSYFEELAAMYRAKRDFLVAALRAAGLKPIVPQGTYFVMVDIGGLGFADDVAFCRYLTTEIGVAAIPPSAFYHDPTLGAGLARFAFCKSDETLERAAERLGRLPSRLPR